MAWVKNDWFGVILSDCLQEASREAAPPTDEPSSGQRPGSSCNSLTENHERTSLQHREMPADLILWIFSSTWLFRESGPDANSRDSPEAPGCFGHFWTVSLDLDLDCLDFVGLDSWCSSEYSWIDWDSLANSLTNSLIDWFGIILSDWFDFTLFSWSGGRSEDTRQTERLTDRQTKGWKDSWVQHWASLKALTF